MLRFSRPPIWAGAFALLMAMCDAHGAYFADSVVDFNQGTGADVLFGDASATTGSPDDLTGENPLASNFYGFANVLGIYSPAYQGDEIFQLGAGGFITLDLGVQVHPIAGAEIGVFESIGLYESMLPDGSVILDSFGADPADVEVSSDSVGWVPLNAGLPIDFVNPAQFYTNAGPYDASAPTSPQRADFGLPFYGTLAGQANNYAAAVAALGGSAGGNWLDISGTGLPYVQFVRFSIPANATTTFELDAVSINPLAVPEPASTGLIIVGYWIARRRR